MQNTNLPRETGTSRCACGLHLACRLLVGLLFLTQALYGMQLYKNGHFDVHAVGSLSVSTLALLMLLVVTSIWLFFGIFTRVMAVFGALLSAALVSLSGLQLYGVIGLSVLGPVLVMLLAPLVVFGGGRFAMHRGGWCLPL